MQIHPQATKTHTLATVLFQIVQSSSVIIDPVVYIVCHEKYRKAMKRVLYVATGKNIAMFETEATFTSTNNIVSKRITRSKFEADTLTRPPRVPAESSTSAWSFGTEEVALKPWWYWKNLTKHWCKGAINSFHVCQKL